ncbi:MAG: hypothetical protein IGS39_02300 [Calothrix sp. C42_A2020_038]|nr:hypothetical protein [Calothrix sp. C42_A2020_038]
METLQQLPLQAPIKEIPDWEKQMADLVGFEDVDFYDEVANSNTLAVVNTNNNDELVAAPQNIKTQKSLSSNPFAKVALVGASTLAVVVVAGTFLSQMMNGNSKQPSKLQQQPIPTNQNLDELEETEAKAEIELLKTKLALAEQANAIKAAQAQFKTPSQPTTTKPVTTPQPPKTITRVVVQKVPTPAPTVYVPKIVTVRVPEPQRVVQAVAPTPQVASRRNSIPTSQVSLRSTIPTLQPVVPARVVPTPNSVTKTPLPNLASAPLQIVEQIASAKEGAEALEPLNAASLNNQPTIVTNTQTAINHEYTTPKLNQSNQRSNNSVAVGTSVKAVLATALFGETNKSANNDNKNDSIFVIRLKQPLKNIDDTIALPEGTEVLTQIRNISENGMLNLNVVSLIRQDNGKLTEISLPENAIKIRAPKGRPLIANKYPDRGRAVAGMDTGLFVLGGIAKVAELSNRTNSQVLTTIGGNIVTQNPRTNILTGVLEGGMNSVVPQITLRNQQAISEMTARSNIWLLKAGTELEVYINQPLQF